MSKNAVLHFTVCNAIFATINKRTYLSEQSMVTVL
jgi:hypothetical protein